MVLESADSLACTSEHDCAWRASQELQLYHQEKFAGSIQSGWVMGFCKATSGATAVEQDREDADRKRYCVCMGESGLFGMWR